MQLTKNTKLHHSVTELGTIQVRQITEYLDDSGKLIDSKYGDPYTPAIKDGVLDLEGWDQKTKDIMEAITTKETKDAFEAEKQVMTGVGPEEIVTYDRVTEDDGRISVRRITRIFDDGKEVSKKYHRSSINPTDDPSSADTISKALAKKLHTKAVKDAFVAKRESFANPV